MDFQEEKSKGGFVHCHSFTKQKTNSRIDFCVHQDAPISLCLETLTIFSQAIHQQSCKYIRQDFSFRGGACKRTTEAHLNVRLGCRECCVRFEP